MVDIFDDEDRAQRFLKYWKDWGIAIVVAILIAIVAFVGWRFVQERQSVTRDQIANLFYEVELATEDEQPTEEMESALVQQYPRSGYSIYVYLLRAKRSVEAEEYELALDHLEDALKVTRDITLKELIKIRMARVYLQLDQQEEALSILPKTTGGYAPYVLEIVGDIHRMRQEYELATKSYQNAILEVYSDDHRQRLELKVSLMPSESTASEGRPES